MRNKIIPLLLIILFAGCAMPAPQSTTNVAIPDQSQQSTASSQQTGTQQISTRQTQSFQTQTTSPSATPQPIIALPLADALSRITKKPFGIYVSPQNSPVQPEHFTGYHTGTDFEIFPDELDKDVPVSAICTGKIEVKRTAQGYGGVLAQSCNLDNQPVTIVYGHLKLTSISQNVSDTLTAGENFALLGDAYSAQTGGERKHLHLGIKKGTVVDLRGYVQKESDLSGWLDFQNLISLP